MRLLLGSLLQIEVRSLGNIGIEPSYDLALKFKFVTLFFASIQILTFPISVEELRPTYKSPSHKRVRS